MAGKDIQLNVTAKDDASKTLDKIADKGERLDGLTADITVGADDNATDTLEKVGGEVDDLEGGDATVSVDADDQATDELAAVSGEVEGLDGAAATITADVDDTATDELATIGAAADDLDGLAPQITPEVDDSAIDDLGSIADAAEELDGLSPDITPTADTSAIDNLSGASETAQGSSEKLAGAMGFLEGKLSSASGEAGGMVEALSGITGAAGPAGLGIAAAGVAAVASAQQFGSLALEAQNFSTVSGTSLDTASRWIEVSGDLGVSAETVQSALGRMNKNIGSGKVSLSELGIAAGGTSENFTALLRYIGGITDETQQAAEGARIFGKAWQGLAPLIVNVGELNSRLGEVSNQKIITADKVKQAEALRDAMDGLHDAIEDVVLAVGSFTVGPITDAVAVVGNLRNAFEETKDTIKSIPMIGDIFGDINIGPLKGITSGIKALRDVTDTSNGTLNAYRSGLGDLASQLPGVGGALDDFIGGQSASEAATEKATAKIREQTSGNNYAAAAAAEYAKKQEDAAAMAKVAGDAAELAASQIDAQTKAFTEQVDAMAAAGDAQFAYNKAARDAAQDLADLPAAIEKINASNDTAETKQRKVQQAYDDAAQSAIKAADTQVALAEDTDTASGKAVTLTGHLDGLNASLLTAAAAADGPMKQAIINYIAQINGIPPEKATAILADTDPANLAAKEAELNEVSRRREATVVIDANTQPAESGAAAFRRKEESDKLLIPVGADTSGIANAIRNAVFGAIPAGQRPGASTSMVAASGVSQLSGVPAVAAAPTATAHATAAPVLQNVKIDIHVKVDPLVNQVRVGKAVADALDAYWRSSGRRPRAVA